MAVDRCSHCVHRGARSDGGCTYSGELPIIPNVDSRCVFTKGGGESRFELHPKFDGRHGKLIVPPGEPSPYPQSAYIQPKPPKPSGYSDSTVEVNGNPVTIRIKDGKCYSANEELKYLGTKEELFPPGPSEKEMDRKIKEVRDSLLKQLT